MVGKKDLRERQKPDHLTTLKTGLHFAEQEWQELKEMICFCVKIILAEVIWVDRSRWSLVEGRLVQMPAELS